VAIGNPANIIIQGQYLRMNSGRYGTRNGGNLWDEGETELTLTDAAEAGYFVANDLVWMTSSGFPNGEVLRVVSVTGAVVTIARETVNSARTGIRWNHTNDGTEMIYLCYRESKPGMHPTEFYYSAPSRRSFTAIHIVASREFKANDGLMCRMLNHTSDGDASMEIALLTKD